MSHQILFIEDHEDTRNLVTYVLEASGYSVTTASTIAAALPSAQANKFDLYLIDNWLPDGLGTQLCESIRQFDRVTPVLFYSGAACDSDKLKAIRAGAQGYLSKPCPFADLLQTIATLIARSDTRFVSQKTIHDLVA